MIYVLEEYISRSLPECGAFVTNPNLSKKANNKGAFLPFYGNTVVFDLDEATKKALLSLQEELYKKPLLEVVAASACKMMPLFPPAIPSIMLAIKINTNSLFIINILSLKTKHNIC